MTLTRPILLDVTRLISTGWMRHNPTGIDRVCDAYLLHYKQSAHAVIQYKGMFRVLSEKYSDRIFEILLNRSHKFRSQLLCLALQILILSKRKVAGLGHIYLNISHTDFDLQSHYKWIKLCNLKTIYMIHDLIPINNYKYCTPHAIKRHKARVVGALNNADGIIVNSNATKTELYDFAVNQGLEIPPVKSAHLGITNIDNGIKYTKPINPYFVCIGTIEPRKNYKLLLQIWQNLIAKKKADIPHLIIIGKWGKQSDHIQDLLDSDPKLSRRVTILNKCDDQQVLSWIKSAKALLFPSLAEGFGIPLIESLAVNTPVIASDLDCFREIGSDIPLLLPPNDKIAWTRAIEGFMNDSEEYKQQKKRLVHFIAPSWKEHFILIDQWLKTIGNS